MRSYNQRQVETDRSTPEHSLSNVTKTSAPDPLLQPQKPAPPPVPQKLRPPPAIQWPLNQPFPFPDTREEPWSDDCAAPAVVGD